MIRTNYYTKKLYFGFLAAVGVLGAVIYPIIIDPIIDPEKYKRIQRETRKHVKREDIQPGNMNIWKNPFEQDTSKTDNSQKV